MMTDEWTTVTTKDKKRTSKGRTRSSNKLHLTSKLVTPLAIEWTDDSKQAIVGQINNYKVMLKETDFFQSLVEIFDKATISPQQMVCYGIGNFARPRSGPLWQLACALNLWDMIHSVRYEEVELFYFDPCTSPMEISILKDFGIQLIEVNERGKRNIHSTPTLFFMPHCPMPLYFNVLLENWENMDKLQIFGNSLCRYAQGMRVKIPQGISLLLPLMKEESTLCSKGDVRDMEGEFDHAFNDCFISTIQCSEELPEKPEDDVQIDDKETL